MELTLTRQSEPQVTVACDNQSSHSFDLRPLLLKNEKDEEKLLNDPVTYGKKLYAALFLPETLACHALINAPKRILLVTTDNAFDAISWEYVYGAYGSTDPKLLEGSEDFLVLASHFVRSALNNSCS